MIEPPGGRSGGAHAPGAFPSFDRSGIPDPEPRAGPNPAPSRPGNVSSGFRSLSRPVFAAEAVPQASRSPAASAGIALLPCPARIGCLVPGLQAQDHTRRLAGLVIEFAEIGKVEWERDAATMIEVTKLNGENIIVNADHIESVEGASRHGAGADQRQAHRRAGTRSPEVVRKVVEYQRSIRSGDGAPIRGPEPRMQGRIRPGFPQGRIEAKCLKKNRRAEAAPAEKGEKGEGGEKTSPRRSPSTRRSSSSRPSLVADLGIMAGLGFFIVGKLKGETGRGSGDRGRARITKRRKRRRNTS